MGYCFSQSVESPRTVRAVRTVEQHNTLFSLQGQRLQARFIDLYDGDTFTLAVEYPRGHEFHYKIRLAGLDCPEQKPLKSNPNYAIEKNAAQAVALFVRGNLESAKSIECHFDALDKYGRHLATVYYVNDQGVKVNLNDQLLGKKFAKPYEGNTKENFTRQELEMILEQCI